MLHLGRPPIFKVQPKMNDIENVIPSDRFRLLLLQKKVLPIHLMVAELFRKILKSTG